MCRLQTVRYESIEVTQEMMKMKTQDLKPLEGKSYKCTLKSPMCLVIEVNEEHSQETEETEETGNLNNSLESEIILDETANPHEKDVKSPQKIIETDNNKDPDDSSFEESLKKYLKLTGTSNFIEVVKTEVMEKS